MTQAGDAWADWLDEHGPALLLFARQWVSERADAEDIVQEGFVRFWRSRQNAADPKAYLYACVKHCAFEWLRRRSRRLRREAATARPDQGASDSLLAAAPERNERRQFVETALRKLPEDQREVLVLKIWGGLTFPQIGAALAISANTAASRYRYALAKLREQLSEEVVP
jgi:RNA polymerase sigma-70 factor, ECF subfamily